MRCFSNSAFFRAAISASLVVVTVDGATAFDPPAAKAANLSRFGPTVVALAAPANDANLSRFGGELIGVVDETVVDSVGLVLSATLDAEVANDDLAANDANLSRFGVDAADVVVVIVVVVSGCDESGHVGGCVVGIDAVLILLLSITDATSARAANDANLSRFGGPAATVVVVDGAGVVVCTGRTDVVVVVVAVPVVVVVEIAATLAAIDANLSRLDAWFCCDITCCCCSVRSRDTGGCCCCCC